MKDAVDVIFSPGYVKGNQYLHFFRQINVLDVTA